MLLILREFACAALFSTLLSLVADAADGRLEIRIVDDQGKLTPARAWVDSGEQRLFTPLTASATPYAKDRSFSCDGSFEMSAPSGSAFVHVEKGKEYQPVDLPVTILNGNTTTLTIQVKRWIDMPKLSWYSADLHVHLGHDNPKVLQQLSMADDVHLIPSFTYWLRGSGEEWLSQWPETSFTDPILADQHHLITRNNIEIERIRSDAAPGASVGATFLFNLNRPVTADRYGPHFPTDAALCRLAREHSPQSVFDSDKPSWAETVVGVALGSLDTIQVCHNHYHRSKTLPGGWGMIGPLAVGESNAAVGDGLFHRTNSLYYRFLNCGFKLGVSGGSAIGVMNLPTGYNRVYAQIDGAMTAEKMWDAIRSGRTFATSGPMLTLTVNDQPIGSTLAIRSDQPQTVTIRTDVQSIDKLESLQIVHNGSIVASRDLSGQPAVSVINAEVEFKLPATRSGWIASRALFRAPDGLLRQAHTSPIYISVDEKPIAFVEDAQYMIRWLEQLAAIANANPDYFPDSQAQQTVLSNYSEAHTRYAEIIRVGEQYWGE